MFSRDDAIAELQRRGKWNVPADAPQAPVLTQETQGSGDGSFTRDLAIGAKNLGVGALTAIPDTLSLAGNLPFYAANLGGYLTGNEKLGNVQAPLPYASDYVNEGINKVTGDYFQPRNFQEKAIGTASNLVGGGKGLAAAKATELAPLMQKYFAPQTAADYKSLVGAGVGLEGGREIAPDSTATQIAGATIGALAPGAKGLAADALRINPEKYKAFKDAGLTPRLADISDSRFVKGAQNALVETPLAGYKITDSIENTKKQIEALTSGGLQQVGAGELAQTGLQAGRKADSTAINSLKDKMISHLSPEDQIMPSNALKVMDDKVSSMTPQARAKFDSTPEGQLHNELRTAIDKNNGSLPYDFYKLVMDDIDNKVTTYGSIGNKTQGAYKYLRGAMKEDVENSVRTKGPEALADYQNYNKYASAVADKNKRIVNGLIKNKTATETFKSIVSDLNVDGKKADTVLRTLNPEQKQVFSQSLVRELGMSPQNEFNPSNFATNFKKLEPKAQEVVLGSFDDATKTKFRATIEAIDAMKGTQAISNPSGSFNQSLRFGVGAGALTHPLLTALSLGGANVSARLMTSPKFINWIASGAKLTDPARIADHIGILAKISKASPVIAPDIAKYLNNMEQAHKPEMQSPQSQPIPSISREEAIQELERRKQSSQAAPQAMPQAPAPEPQAQMQQQPSSPIDDTFLKKVAMIESGGNPNAKAQGSTASGMYQFTNGTWRDVVNKYGNETGISLKDKNNPQAQAVMVQKMMQDNAPELQKILGHEPSHTDLYLSHFLGLAGAKRLLNANSNKAAADVLPDAARSNPTIFYANGRPLTVAQFYQNLNKKVMSA